MNSFKSELEAAQARQRRFTLVMTLGLLLAGVLALGLFLSLGATTLRISPQDASLNAQIDVSSGLGIVVDSRIYSLGSEVAITVTAPGYQKLEQQLTAANRGKYLDLVLKELPGRLLAQSRPDTPEANWYLNDQLITTAASLDQKLRAGDYILKVDHPGFEIWTQRLTIARGQDLSLEVDLEPIQGTINLKSTPEGAQVIINGRRAGKTPLNFIATAGTKSIQLKLNGYQVVRDEVVVTRKARHHRRDYQLERAQGLLIVTTEPEGGQLMVAGRKALPGAPLPLAAGEPQIIAYSKTGYQEKRIETTLKPGERKVLRIKLEPKIGTVTITSTPTADVEIDGKPAGKTPLEINLRSVRHKIVVSRPGYRSQSFTALPQHKQVIDLKVILQKEEDARLAESPARYKNSLGIELQRFEGGTLTMGAPRGEKGQRANEFQRQVSLTRPFYAATTEVTNAQFAAFQPAKTSGPGDFPVVNVTWQEAAAFCNWLSKKEGRQAFYRIQNGRYQGFNPSADGYRLLSEAEWEWLARKAGRTAQTTFTWGNDTTIPAGSGNIADENAKGTTAFYVPNYQDGFTGLAPVGSFKPEASGLQDLSGNASEWVQDVYDLTPPLKGAVAENPLGLAGGSSHVVKGSNWRSGTRTTLRSAYRQGLTKRQDDVGFRIGRYVAPAGSP
ncbi:SUMF1/EgtB/PvdO family nonheme iron enzyme [Rhodovibrionaceae bacterium A322]